VRERERERYIPLTLIVVAHGTVNVLCTSGPAVEAEATLELDGLARALCVPLNGEVLEDNVIYFDARRERAACGDGLVIGGDLEVSRGLHLCVGGVGGRGKD
jgi:hypothetical protein